METFREKYNPACIQKDRGHDTAWRQRNRVQNKYPQQGDEGKKEINAQVVRGHSPQRRHGTT